MTSASFPCLRQVRGSSRAPMLAAMMWPAWSLALLPGFFDVDRDLPIAAGGPSLWALVGTLPGIRTLPLTGLAMAAAIGVATALLAWIATRPPRGDRAWSAALLAALALPTLLPATTVLDLLPAVAMAAADAWVRRDDRIVRWVAAGLAATIVGQPALGALAIGWAIRLAADVAIDLPANDNALPPGPHRLYPPMANL